MTKTSQAIHEVSWSSVQLELKELLATSPGTLREQKLDAFDARYPFSSLMLFACVYFQGRLQKTQAICEGHGLKYKYKVFTLEIDFRSQGDHRSSAVGRAFYTAERRSEFRDLSFDQVHDFMGGFSVRVFRTHFEMEAYSKSRSCQ